MLWTKPQKKKRFVLTKNLTVVAQQVRGIYAKFALPDFQLLLWEAEHSTWRYIVVRVHSDELARTDRSFVSPK